MTPPRSTPIDLDLLARGGVRCEVDDVVATVTLDRPEVRNAQTPSTWAALAHLGEVLPSEVRVVVLRGAGESFSAGLDVRLLDGRGVDGEESIPDLLQRPDAEIDAWIARCQEGFAWLRNPRFITVAVVHGHAYGAGLQLALSCDYRIGVEGLRLCMKEAALGLVPDLTGTKPLVELVGYSRALDIVATARVVDGDEALALGLVNRLVPQPDLDDAVAAVVAAFTGPPAGAVRDCKLLVAAASEQDLEAQCALERARQLVRFAALGAGAGEGK